MHLPEPAEEPFNIDEIEANIRALIASFATEIPGMIVGVRGGSVEVRIGDRPPVMITELEGRLVARPVRCNYGSVPVPMFSILCASRRVLPEILSPRREDKN